MESLDEPKSSEEMLEKWHSDIPPSLKQLFFNINCHPATAIFLVVFTIIALGPFLFFVCFALGSFAFMLIGFILVEGTLLVLGTVVLAFVLTFATVMAFSASLTLGGLWFVITNWKQLVEECRQLLDKQVKQINEPLKLDQ